MISRYLDINDCKLNYDDGVFCGIAPLTSNENVSNFCDKQAYNMRYSELGNYEDLTMEEREELARRWEAVKDLPDGEYEYYFNLEDKVEVFKESVKTFAQKLGIKYELKIIDDEDASISICLNDLTDKQKETFIEYLRTELCENDYESESKENG